MGVGICRGSYLGVAAYGWRVDYHTAKRHKVMRGKSTAFIIFAMVLGLIGIGLVLRMGNVSVPLANNVSGLLKAGLNTLTLKNYSPANTAVKPSKGQVIS